MLPAVETAACEPYVRCVPAYLVMFPQGLASAREDKEGQKYPAVHKPVHRLLDNPVVFPNVPIAQGKVGAEGGQPTSITSTANLLHS